MRVLIFCWGFASLVFAQSRILSEGYLTGGGPTAGLRVEVAEGSGKFPPTSALVQADSSFRIELPSHDRTLEFRVLNTAGAVIQVISHWPIRGVPIELRLTEISENSKQLGAISAKRLSFRPSAERRRAIAHALKLNAAGKHSEAIAALEDIVKAEPNWFEAWVELGNVQAIAGKTDLAVISLREAISIDPNAAPVYPSLGFLLLRLRQPSEAALAAEGGLKANPDCIKSKYILGLAMGYARNTSARAISLLEEVQSHFPDAMVSLAAIFFQEGQFEASRDAAWRYLHMAKTPRGELASKIWREASASLRIQ